MTTFALATNTGLMDEFLVPSPFMRDITASMFPDAVSEEESKNFFRSASRYQVTEDDKKFQLAVDIPSEMTVEDVTVQVRPGNVLHLSGRKKMEKKEEGDDGTFTSTSDTQFQKSFTMDQTVDTTKMTANFSDGVLVIAAPKNPAHSDVQKIAITTHKAVEPQKKKLQNDNMGEYDEYGEMGEQ
mmetsp:Transcript_15563/g.22949  ORF Transcript_15563/g.22949 Transcript_15563/m.22949 type:complete len:184 (+) Transcript_15563:61-612(+)